MKYKTPLCITKRKFDRFKSYYAGSHVELNSRYLNISEEHLNRMNIIDNYKKMKQGSCLN